MPVHPTSACYCHVIEAGHANLVRQIEAGDTQTAQVELVHIQAVTAILSDYLLYAPNDPRWSDSTHDRYWDSIRPAYMRSADDSSILAHYIAWEFLAISTRFELRDQIVLEGQQLRRRFDLRSAH
jgi:hypothetical protein